MSPLGPRYRAGETVGRWTLLDLIGVGRNGEVWRVDEEDPKALKVLRASNPQAEQYLRFRDEEAILRRLTGRPGILPLVDSSVPDHPSRKDPAWILSPLATSIHDALEGNTLEEIVVALHSIARTLADLHAESIFHRDIKPDNLFRLADEFVIGDFGLVDFPDKQDVTQLREDQRHPGPLYYLAPELLTAGEIDPAPTDVYALAKTMWVLATGQSYPLPGPLDIAIPGARLSSFAQGSRASILDRLLHRATQHDAEVRPSMVEFANELNAWLTAPAEGAIPDVEDLVARIASAAQPSIRREQEMESLVQLASDSAQSLVHEVMGLEEAYKKFGVRYVPRQEDDVVLRAFRRGNLMGVPTVIWEWGVAARALVEKGGITFFIATGYGGELREDGTIQIGCGHVVGHRVGLQDHLDDRWLWISEPVQVGSAAEERERAEIVAHVREDFPKALAWFERVVAGSG